VGLSHGKGRLADEAIGSQALKSLKDSDLWLLTVQLGQLVRESSRVKVRRWCRLAPAHKDHELSVVDAVSRRDAKRSIPERRMQASVRIARRAPSGEGGRAKTS